MISPSQECVDINLLNDTSIEGDHTFSVSLEDLPMMSTAGHTDILIIDSTDGGFSKLAGMYVRAIFLSNLSAEVDPELSQWPGDQFPPCRIHLLLTKPHPFFYCSMSKREKGALKYPPWIRHCSVWLVPAT